MPASRKVLFYYERAIVSLGLLILLMLAAWNWPLDWAWVAAAAVIMGLCEIIQVAWPSGVAGSASGVVVLVLLWLNGLVVPMWAIFLALLPSGLMRRASPLRTLFNGCQLALSVLVAGMVFLASGGVFNNPFGWESLPAHILSGAAYFLVNDALVIYPYSLSSQISFLSAWLNDIRDSGWTWAFAWAAALVAYAGYSRQGVWWLVGALLLLLGQQLLLVYYAEVARGRVIGNLLDVASRRDLMYKGHSDRVMKYAVAIARQLGLPQSEIRNIRYAALLHDIGLERVRAEILEKGGPLTAEEKAEMARHPREGERIIGRLSVLMPVAQIIRYHHEWFNGNGYPDGLAGEEIPIGSRILMVANAFEAMVCGRPYRQSLSPEEGLRELKAYAGSQFDPRVVAALEAVLPGLCAEPGSSLAVPGEDLEAEILTTIKNLRDYMAGARATLPRAGLQAQLPYSWKDTLALGEIRYKAAQILALYELGQMINSSLSLEEVLERVASTAGRLVEGAAFVAIYDPRRAELEVKSVYHLPIDMRGHRFPISEGLVDLTAGVSPSSACPPGFPGYPKDRWGKAGFKSFLHLPMVSKGKLIGLLVVLGTEPTPFREDEVDLLTIVTGQAALAIDNARLYAQTEQRLREVTEMKQFTDAVLEHAGVAIVVMDLEGRLTLANSSARTLWEVLGTEGMPLCRQCGKPGANPICSLLWEVIDAGEERYRRECRFPASNGKEIILEIQATPLQGKGGEVTGSVAILRDITGQVEMDERVRQAEKLAVVGELAAGAAHEIRNPLTAIKGFSQLLGRKCGEEGKEYLDIIVGEIDRIDSIVNDLLLLARPSAPELKPCSLAAVVGEVGRMLGEELSLRRLRFTQALPADLPPIRADARQMKQVFWNLITNSLHATPQGGEIRVEASYLDRQDMVQARVTDTGVGIPVDHLNRIFDPFFTTKENGTGLGLTITYGIIQAHGGSIEVESHPGQGTTFDLYLPAFGAGGGP